MTEWVADEGVAKVVTRAELQNCDAWKRAYRNKCKDHRYYEIVEETLEGRLRQGTPYYFKQFGGGNRLLQKGKGTEAERLSFDISPAKCGDDDNRQFRQGTRQRQNPASTEHRHPQVSDDQVEPFFRIRKSLRNRDWIGDASDLHAFTGKHFSHRPEHSRIVIYDQNRFVLQLVHNLFKE